MSSKKLQRLDQGGIRLATILDDGMLVMAEKKPVDMSGRYPERYKLWWYPDPSAPNRSHASRHETLKDLEAAMRKMQNDLRKWWVVSP